MAERPVVRIKNVEGVAAPEYKTSGAAGADVCSAENSIIHPGEWLSISTGIFLEVPADHECQIRPRSGLAMKSGVTVLNSPGCIDSDYRGEIKVLLINHGTADYSISVGDRIAQLVIAPVTQVIFRAVDELSDTDRGTGGFGSTGMK